MNKELARKTFILTDEQKADLFNQYYNSDKPTTELIKEFGLSGLRSSQITYLFDDVITDVKCEYCGTLMQHEPPTRSSTEKDLYCPLCGHRFYRNSYDNFNCSGCIDKRNKMIENYITEQRTVQRKSIDELSVWGKLLLGALIHYGADGGNVISLSGYHCNLQLLANNDETDELINYFKDNSYLVLSKANSINNFSFRNNGTEFELSSHWGEKVFYDIWLSENDLEILKNGNFNLSNEEISELWLKINKDEALNFLLSIFEKYYITNYNIEEIDQIFDNYVRKFSLLQILNVIIYVTKQPAQDIALSDNRKQARIQAARDIVKHLKNYYNWVLKNNYEVREIELNTFNFSMATKFFYYKILKQGEIGFSLIAVSE